MSRIRWLQLLILVSVFSIVVIASRKERRALKKCSNNGIAKVVDKYKSKSRYYMKYRYQVKEKKYSRSIWLTSAEEDQFHLGDSIKIITSCDDPSISEPIKIK